MVNQIAVKYPDSYSGTVSAKNPHNRTQLKPSPIPRHIAFIMDGNGRWALKRGLPRTKGHEKGSEKITKILEDCFEMGISVVSLYSFSTENWRRPKKEIQFLFSLLEKFIRDKLIRIKEKEIKIIISGDISSLNENTQKLIRKAVRETKSNQKYIVNFCLNYGSRNEIYRAVNLILKEKLETYQKTSGNSSTKSLSSLLSIQPKDFEKYLYTHELPDVDFLVRTAGTRRLSNFLLYQSAYAELYFTDVLWPDFDQNELIKCIASFQDRERKFGGLPNG